jgi:polyphenol oxidase
VKEIVFGDWKVCCGLAKEYEELPVLAKQIHSANILKVDKKFFTEEKADGLVTRSKGTKVGVYTSDCLPLVLIGEEQAGVLHVSRKSLAVGILKNVSNVLNTHRLKMVWVGPHICEKHFVFENMGTNLEMLWKIHPEAFKKDREVWQVNLLAAVKKQLHEWGYKGKVEEDGRCTFEDLNLPSYRRGDLGKIVLGTSIVTSIQRLM